MVGDGNCFFRCLSMQLFQSQDQHYAIRSVLSRFENLNRGTFEKMLMPAVNEPTFPGHIRIDYTWYMGYSRRSDGCSYILSSACIRVLP